MNLFENAVVVVVVMRLMIDDRRLVYSILFEQGYVFCRMDV